MYYKIPLIASLIILIIIIVVLFAYIENNYQKTSEDLVPQTCATIQPVMTALYDENYGQGLDIACSYEDPTRPLNMTICQYDHTLSKRICGVEITGTMVPTSCPENDLTTYITPPPYEICYKTPSGDDALKHADMIYQECLSEWYDYYIPEFKDAYLELRRTATIDVRVDHANFTTLEDYLKGHCELLYGE